MNLKQVAVLVAVVILTAFGMAIEDKPAAKKHAVNPSLALKIRDAQVKTLSIQQQIVSLTQQREQASSEIQDAITAAYADAKLKPEEWQINDTTWEFIARPKPAAKAEPEKK